MSKNLKLILRNLLYCKDLPKILAATFGLCVEMALLCPWISLIPVVTKSGLLSFKLKLTSFKNYAGTFRSFFSNGDFYIAGSQRVLQINADGRTHEVPGIPLETQKGVFASARQDAQKRFVVDLKDAKSKNCKKFLCG